MKKQTTSLSPKKQTINLQNKPTFMDHLQELKSRLFWVAAAFIISAALAYPFFQQIVDLLVMPLGDHELYYMTPSGGFGFIIKICLYAGVVGALPILVYQLYQFLSPIMKKTSRRSLLLYSTASFLLALAGISFSYFISLPTALRFLTNIEIDQVSDLLTIDSYISFVVAYLVVGALLFQLPLIMLIINGVNPQPPKKLFGLQKYVITGSFILAAILSPTPDVVNQSIMAAPMVAMYQVGVMSVWTAQRKSSKLNKRAKTGNNYFNDSEISKLALLVSQPKQVSQYKTAHQPAATRPVKPANLRYNSKKSMNDIIRRPSNVKINQNTALQRSPALAHSIKSQLSQQVHKPARSLDGFIIRAT